MTQTSTYTTSDVTPLFSGIIRDDQIRVTPAAHAQIKALVDTEEDVLGIRIFVAGGGCGGMGYSMTFATERHEHDCVLEQDGLSVFIDAVALSFLEGVEVDYVQGPMGANLVFRNAFQAIGGGGGCPGCSASQV